MRRTLVILILMFASLFASAQTLSLTQSGSGNTAAISVTSSGQFKLTWDAADNWGLDGWCDLVNDAACTTNLASPVYAVNGPSVPCAAENGLANYVFYSEGDEKQFMEWVSNGCTYSSTTRSMEILINTPSVVVLQSTSFPIVTTGPSSKLIARMTYSIFPNGRIYVHNTINALSAFTLGTGTWGSDFAMVIGLPNSLQTGTAPPDSQSVGWVRASATQNPYNFNNADETYLYAYWGSSSGAWGYGSSMVPKASIMIVPSPNNSVNTTLRQGIHSWACGTGCGVTRWGYLTTTAQSLLAGQTISYDWLLQLGTQGSAVLPNMTVTPPANCSTCDTIANAYIASPYPPDGLLTGMTPTSYTLPSGWTLTTSDTFEGSSCPGAWYCDGDFSSAQAHSGTKSLHKTYQGLGSLTWNEKLPVNTREVYVSWYEQLSSTYRQNDEMFLMRFHWDVGNGFPAFRESILDYFQDATGTYDSTDATLLWNIQGFPYYQNRLPTNMMTDLTNWPILTAQWVQNEMYVKFSTVSGTISLAGATVSVNGPAHTYTRSAGSWTTDGVNVGDSLHFGTYDSNTGNCAAGVTCFANNENNGWGEQGGGASSYFVTSVTPTVLTVLDPDNLMVTEGPVSGLSYQVDHADGAYRYYKNGSLVAFQDAMINPGKYDFSTQPTVLSLGESYSKLIWHQQVAGNCEVSAPFTGACSTNISGCGYDNLAGVNGVTVHGWDGAGLTQSGTPPNTFNTHINCDATWGGPMPTPPVFDRYVDDVMVLTKSGSAPATSGTVSGGASISGGVVIR